VRESEGGWAVLQFSSNQVWEGDRRRHVTRQFRRPVEGEKAPGGPMLGQNGPR
jgi:hypothetical protein